MDAHGSVVTNAVLAFACIKDIRLATLRLLLTEAARKSKVIANHIAPLATISWHIITFGVLFPWLDAPLFRHCSPAERCLTF